MWWLHNLLFLGISSVYALVVETSYGKVEGRTIDVDGKETVVFLGVPYSLPPVGNRRFALPVPPIAWNGVLNATKYRPACPSNQNPKSDVFINDMDEDCLYINIFTSTKCMKTSCPVIFYVHGGGLFYDTATTFNETFLVERYAANDVVFVTSDYRLGFFGNLYFGNDLVPMNLAIYDTVLALEWNHNEISNFGGNPDKVTLMGHSSGAEYAMMMGFSREIDPDRRLFKNVISLSAVNLHENAKLREKQSEEFVRKANCLRSNPEETMKCVRMHNSTFLLAVQREIEVETHNLKGILFGPPFANANTSIQEFIANPPKRNMLISTTSLEEDVCGRGTRHYEMGNFIGLTHSKVLREKFNADWLDENGEEQLPCYFSQIIYISAVAYGTSMEKKDGHVYMQEFSQPPLPTHASDLKFFVGLHRSNLTEDDLIIDQLYSRRLVNFAIHGKPSPEARRFNYPTSNYYRMIVDRLNDLWPSYEKNYHEKLVEYWKDMAVLDSLLSIGDMVREKH